MLPGFTQATAILDERVLCEFRGDKEQKLMTAGEVRTLATLVSELGSANFKTAVSANFGNLADDSEVALDVVAVLFPPSAPFDVAAGVLLELAVYFAPSIHWTPDPESNRRRADDTDPRRSWLSFRKSKKPP